MSAYATNGWIGALRGGEVERWNTDLLLQQLSSGMPLTLCEARGGPGRQQRQGP